ncbi:hypothetical protein MRX96_026237 [Rhipicephalus microplus]
MDVRRQWGNERLPKVNGQLPFAHILNKTNEEDSSTASVFWEAKVVGRLEQRTISGSRHVKETVTSGKVAYKAPADASDHVSCLWSVTTLVLVGIALVMRTRPMAMLDAPFEHMHAVSNQLEDLLALAIDDRSPLPNSVRGDCSSLNLDGNTSTTDLTTEVPIPLTVDETDRGVATQPRDD